MPVEAFFDTNILVYAAVGSGKDAPKRKRALELIESTDFGTSAQVLQWIAAPGTAAADASKPNGGPAYGASRTRRTAAFSTAGRV